MLNKTNNSMILIPLTFLTISIPVSLLMQHEILNVFLYPYLSYVALVRSNTNLDKINLYGFLIGGYDDPYISYIMINSILSTIAGLTSSAMAIFPIGSILICVTYYIFVRRITNSPTISSILTIILFYEPFFLGGFYSVFYYAWTFPIYLSLVILTMRLTIEKFRKLNRNIMCIIIMFFSLQYYHPTITFWAVCIPILIMLASLVKHKFKFKDFYLLKTFLNILLIFIIIYITANSLIFYFVQKVKYINLLPELIDKTFGLLIPPSKDAYEIGYFVLSDLTRSLKLIYHAALLVPIFSYFLSDFISFFTTVIKNETSKESDQKHEFIIYIATFTFVFYTSFYLLFGPLNTKYLLFFVPIASVLSIIKINEGPVNLGITARVFEGENQFLHGYLHALFAKVNRVINKMRNKKILVIMYIILLLVITGGKFVSAWMYDPISYKLTLSEIKPVETWITNHLEDGKILIFTDISLAGGLTLSAAESRKKLNIEIINDKNFYEFDQKALSAHPSEVLVILNIIDKDKAIPSKGWGYLPPLSPYIPQVLKATNYYTVYNGLVWTLYFIS